MKKFLGIIGALLTISLLVSCNKGFYSPDYEAKTADHKLIAVLPVNTILLGRPPKGLTQDDIRQIEEAESLAFQKSLSRSIMRAASRNNRQLIVNVQPIGTTNQILDDNNVYLRESWVGNPVELARILQVDAVVSTRVEKYQYFSDLTSFGISLANDIAFILSRGSTGFIEVNTQNKDVAIDYEVINGADGTLLWSMSMQEGADWQKPANQIIDEMTWQMAKRFPYLQKK